jgi:hypothetical protein
MDLELERPAGGRQTSPGSLRLVQEVLLPTIGLRDRTIEPIMCPAIVGRPGMNPSSCPADNPMVRRKYGPLLARREAGLCGGGGAARTS